MNSARDPPMSAAHRRNRLVIGETALLRYLPEALRLQLGHCRTSSLKTHRRKAVVRSLTCRHIKNGQVQSRKRQRKD
jgi:hypothetical protein